MKKLLLFSCLLIAICVQAQKEKAEAYISSYKELAISEMIRTGVPAAITLAQGVLESGCGESDLSKTSNNHFGIKCKTEWTGAKTYHDDDEKGECFRVYPTVADSYRDHSDFLKNRPYYAELFKLDPTDYTGWAKGLKKAGYATSPTYPQQLLKVINDYDLQQYSIEAIARQKNGTVTSIIHTTQTTAKTETPQPDLPRLTKTTSFPLGIFSINHSKVVFATAGSSLLALANQYDVPLSKLLEYNELSETDVLNADGLVFIEKKPKKGAYDFHISADGESLYDISQLEGVRLESILEYNGLKKGAVVTSGAKIYLR